MPITLHQGSLKYKNQQGNFTDIDCIKGEDYVLTAQDKEDIAGMVNVPVTDVQVNGTSVVTDGVANVPVATSENAGVVSAGQIYGYYGINVVNGRLETNPADLNAIKQGANGHKPIVPSFLHSAVFYGLAKAAGDTTQSQSSNAVGTYTDAAKSAISTMLNSPVSVSGSTPSITALPGIQYVCGECSTLNITVPASGDIEVIFESGSTATTLTVTPPSGITAIKWANNFNPSSLNTNTRYDLIITDGEWGMAASWAI